MSPPRLTILGLALVLLAHAAWGQTLGTSPIPPRLPPAQVATNLMPPLPTMQSPVAFFRQLLILSPVEREQSLTNRTPEARARIMAKVHEYQLLNPDERELRLRATELRWYLVPLLRTPPADRAGQLARIPPEFGTLVQSRLAQWDLLPPPLQQEFLTNDPTLHYFAQPPPPANTRQQQLTAAFHQFLELKPAEKTLILATLSETERAQMEKTLQTFQHLPVQQRALCLRNFGKFAGMTSAERAEFLKNSESWAKMSPQERQAWRDLVAHVPLWPPMPAVPPAIMPPHFIPKPHSNSVATN